VGGQTSSENLLVRNCIWSAKPCICPRCMQPAITLSIIHQIQRSHHEDAFKRLRGTHADREGEACFVCGQAAKGHPEDGAVRNDRMKLSSPKQLHAINHVLHHPHLISHCVVGPSQDSSHGQWKFALFATHQYERTAHMSNHVKYHPRPQHGHARNCTGLT